jgi:hypothetical protein
MIALVIAQRKQSVADWFFHNPVVDYLGAARLALPSVAAIGEGTYQNRS